MIYLFLHNTVLNLIPSFCKISCTSSSRKAQHLAAAHYTFQVLDAGTRILHFTPCLPTFLSARFYRIQYSSVFPFLFIRLTFWLLNWLPLSQHTNALLPLLLLLPRRTRPLSLSCLKGSFTLLQSVHQSLIIRVLVDLCFFFLNVLFCIASFILSFMQHVCVSFPILLHFLCAIWNRDDDFSCLHKDTFKKKSISLACFLHALRIHIIFFCDPPFYSSPAAHS